ncbi:MAG: sigma-54-dependent Fis family transcriptional regulator [Candidatus Marinimicrobia bacterium]|nr:sigma-54-dependent Fis family transcriptional regulator [Candidatus Neomarinimicrobiota bacterium]
MRKSANIIGKSEKMNEMLSMIGQVATTDISVLITGASGVGKEMAAKAIHRNSKRKHEKLITVNCAAIPTGIIESELFGHKKGSFTGATESRKGYFEAADKGTIFLDEIGELPLEIQAKLLRVIEQGEFIRVGDTKSEKIDTRIIAATNRDLLLEVKEKNFRQDLYYRLKTVNINVPSLVEHMDDIFDLVERFGFEFTVKNDIPYKGFDSAAIDIMKSYEWPGNVRELKNVVESLLVMNKGKRITADIVKEKLNMETISSNMNLPMPVDMESDQVERELILKQLLYLRQDINDIKQILVNPSASASVSGETTPSNSALFLPSPNSISSPHDNKENIEDASMYALNEDTIGEISLDELEHEMIKRCLEKFKGNRRKTAQVLNISERTLYRKIKEYEI